jgi:hypothetical protein
MIWLMIWLIVWLTMRNGPPGKGSVGGQIWLTMSRMTQIVSQIICLWNHGFNPIWLI